MFQVGDVISWGIPRFQYNNCALAAIESYDQSIDTYHLIVLESDHLAPPGRKLEISGADLYYSFRAEVEANLITIENTAYSGAFWEIAGLEFKNSFGKIAEKMSVSERHKCHCKTFDVINFGCKCGGI